MTQAAQAVMLAPSNSAALVQLASHVSPCTKCDLEACEDRQFWLKPLSLELSVFFDAGLGVWFVVLCCCRDPGAVVFLANVFLLCWCGLWRSCSRRISGQECLAMVSKLRRGVRGSQGKSVLKEFWRVRSRLMGEWSGFVNSAQNQMCGRGGVAGAASMTFRQGCVGSTSRLSPQGLENGPQCLRRQAGRKIERPKVWRQETRIFGPA